MNMVTNAEITQLAKDVWMGGYRGGAAIDARFSRPLTLEESNHIRETMRPLVEAEVAKLKSMKKNDLNKNYVMSFIRAAIKLDGEQYNEEFTIETACKTHHVNGRRICEVMSVDEILREPLHSYARLTNDWHDSKNYISLSPNEDGTYTRKILGRITQPPIEIARKNWPRQRCKNDFVKLVKDYITKCNDEGWVLVSTSYESFGSKHSCLVFEKKAA